MSNSGSKPLFNSNGGQAPNPFARALSNLENEQSLNKPQPSQVDPLAGFNEALSKTGGNFDFGSPNSDDASNYGDVSNLNNDAYTGYGQDNQDPNTIFDQQAEFKKQQEEAERQQYLARRKALHREVNPIHDATIFERKEQQNKQALELTRQQIAQVVHQTQHPPQDLATIAIAEVVDPGIERAQGKKSLLEHALAWGKTVMNNAKESNHWATQLHGKSSKKKQKGMQIGGLQHEKTSTIQDMTTNHERNTQFSGG